MHEMADPKWPETRIIETSVVINAPPSKIKRILTDFPSYPSWSSFITSIEPSPTPSQETPAGAVGSKLSVALSPPGGSGMTMTPTVVKNDAEGFGWQGHLANVSGLFDGKHLFLLKEEGAGQTKLVHREEFAGFLFVPLMKWMGMEAKTKTGFEHFNEAIKKRAESS